MIEVGTVPPGVTPHCDRCGADFVWSNEHPLRYGGVPLPITVPAGWAHSCPCSCKEGYPDRHCYVHGNK